MSKIICPRCGGEHTKEFIEQATLSRDDKVIATWDYAISYCEDCDINFNTKEQMARNRRAEADASRKVHDGYIAPEDVLKLPRRYNISRAMFKIVMGFHEVHDTGTEDDPYWDVWDMFAGDLPNDEENAKLKKVLADPKYYIELVEQAKDKIPPDVYQRTMERAKSLM